MMDDMQMHLDIHPGITTVEVLVNALHVSDNSGDERFPFIFESLPAEG